MSILLCLGYKCMYVLSQIKRTLRYASATFVTLQKILFFIWHKTYVTLRCRVVNVASSAGKVASRMCSNDLKVRFKDPDIDMVKVVELMDEFTQ